MQGNTFFDTNIWLYQILTSEDSDTQRKKQIAIQLCLEQNIKIFTSVQVLNEVSNVLLKKFYFEKAKVLDFVNQIVNIAEIIPLQISVTFDGIEIYSKYKFSFYDSLIVASALSVKCCHLVTEDLQNQQVIDYKSHQLQIVNPFKELV
jgi:predicted nucleic acid-binding protein